MPDGQELRGAEKKEAFHLKAEELVHSFSFESPDVDVAEGRKIHAKLAGTDSCRASIQVLKGGCDNNLHYHPNMDLIWMVLKGTVRFYGPGDVVRGDFGPQEGIMQPQNSRYWFKNVGEGEAWLLQIAGFPKGEKAAKRIPCEPPKPNAGPGVWVDFSGEGKELGGVGS